MVRYRPMPSNDLELFDSMAKKLFPAVIGDILDRLGYTRQFLPREIQPLRDEMVVLGRAMPVLETDCDGDEEGEPFGIMFQALDDLHPGEVYLAAGGSASYAMWGELMSTRAMKLGAAGAVLSGCSRDTRGILQLGFPTFSIGRYAQDQRARGRVVDFRCPATIGQVRVNPGEIVFGDLDGVLVIPREVEAEALRKALEKVDREDKVRSAIGRGMSACDAWRDYGVF